jgi:uncharacterized membrane protein
MPRVENAIDIQAPPERVFAMIANYPERMPDWWNTFELQQRVTPPPTQVGSVSRYVYNMMGVKIKGEHQVIEMTENAYLLVKTISGIDSIFEFVFEPLGDAAAETGESVTGTRLTIRVNYSLPGSVLGQLLNRLTLEQKNERDLQQALINLKALIETQMATQN